MSWISSRHIDTVRFGTTCNRAETVLIQPLNHYKESLQILRLAFKSGNNHNCLYHLTIFAWCNNGVATFT